MAQFKILVVDDEPTLTNNVQAYLEREGFAVRTAADGLAALQLVRAWQPDLIVLDIMLPGLDGIEVLRRVRQESEVYVLMLTAKADETDKIVGLNVGADDYMTKPFSPRELVARVNTVLRRAGVLAAKEKVIRIGELRIDRETYTVTKRDVPLNLSATEFKLLLYLAERKGRVFSRDQLLDAVWKDESFVEPRTVDVHIRRLRTQIEDDPSDPVHLKTRRGVGYYVE